MGRQRHDNGLMLGHVGDGLDCIDIAISINEGGTFGTTAALATCGANNLTATRRTISSPMACARTTGSASFPRLPHRHKSGHVRDRWGQPDCGIVFGDGVDIASGFFIQSSAFTCNIVAAKVVQCVKGPAYSGGVITGVGQWSSGATYISYGDLTIVSGRILRLRVCRRAVVSVHGRQRLHQWNADHHGDMPNRGQRGHAAAVRCHGGRRSDRRCRSICGYVRQSSRRSRDRRGVHPVAVGARRRFGRSDSVDPTRAAGRPRRHRHLDTDSNTMGMFLYDNSGFLGNPLNSFFTNGQGGYFEPGLRCAPSACSRARS